MPVISSGQLTIVDTNDGINARLSNEAQIVATDAQGFNGNFSQCVTQMLVFLGNTDDTLKWSFSAAPSIGLSGQLTGNEYAVSSLEGDSGFVDITATRVGFASLTSRFTVTKAKQGVAGNAIQLVATLPGFFFKDNAAFPASQSIGFTLIRNGASGPVTFFAEDGVPLATDRDTFTAGMAVFGLYGQSEGDTAYLKLSDFGSRQSLTVTAICDGQGSSVNVVRLDSSTAEAGATVGGIIGVNIGGQITPGNSNDLISAEALFASQINTRGLSIKDAQGNIILAAGTALKPEYLDANSLVPGISIVKTANVDVNGPIVRKISGANNWDAAAHSSNYYTTCRVSAKVLSMLQNAMIGLNTDPATNTSFTGIDYAWYLNGTGNVVSIYQGGTLISSHGALTLNTVVSIAYDGANIYFIKDGAVVRTVAVANNLTLYFDSSLNNTLLDGGFSYEYGPFSNFVGEIGKLGQITQENADVVLGDSIINSARIAEVLQSTNYNPGVAGWKISKQGDVEFSSGVFRGALSAATGTFNGVVTGTISAGSINVSELGGLPPFIFTTPGTYTNFHTMTFNGNVRYTVIGGGGGGGRGKQGVKGARGRAGSALVAQVAMNVLTGTNLTAIVGAGGAGSPTSGGVDTGAVGALSRLTIGGTSFTANGGVASEAPISAGTAGFSELYILYHTENYGDAGGGHCGERGEMANLEISEGGRGGGDNRSSISFRSGVVADLTGKVGKFGGGGGGGAPSTLFVPSRGFSQDPIDGDGGDGVPFFAGGKGGDGYVFVEVFNPNSVVLFSEWDAFLQGINGNAQNAFWAQPEVETVTTNSNLYPSGTVYPQYTPWTLKRNTFRSGRWERIRYNNCQCAVTNCNCDCSK